MSDEEIDKARIHYSQVHPGEGGGKHFEAGAKWMREVIARRVQGFDIEKLEHWIDFMEGKIKPTK